MKIAVASMGKEVAGHFGHCENFNIYDTENGAIQKDRDPAAAGNMITVKINRPLNQHIR